MRHSFCLQNPIPCPIMKHSNIPKQKGVCDVGLFTRKRKRGTEITCSVVMLAAGSSRRMGEDKIMKEIGGVPVVVRSLRAFDAIEEVKEIIVVTREDLVPEIAGLCKSFGIEKVKKIVRGGESRVYSARLGTLDADGNTQLIAIHDAARPFVSATVIREAIEKAAATGAAAPALPVKDTIKVAKNGLTEGALDRSTLFAVQTPQVFENSLIRAALQKAIDDHAEVTDDCSAVERLGMKVSLTAGDERNFKLTTPMDLIVAEAMLEGAEQ